MASLGCLARAASAAVCAEALEERAVQVNIAAHIECAQHSDRIGETGQVGDDVTPSARETDRDDAPPRIEVQIAPIRARVPRIEDFILPSDLCEIAAQN
jgi:hypothetical protein